MKPAWRLRLDLYINADDRDHAEEVWDAISEHLQMFDEIMNEPQLIDLERREP